LRTTALARISVGVTVERRKARSAWADFLWRPVSVFTGSPSAAPWTPLGMEAETTLFYVGEAAIELHRTETSSYRDNLASGAPALWIVLRPTASELPYELVAVTADRQRAKDLPTPATIWLNKCPCRPTSPKWSANSSPDIISTVPLSSAGAMDKRFRIGRRASSD